MYDTFDNTYQVCTKFHAGSSQIATGVSPLVVGRDHQVIQGIIRQ